MIYYIYNNFLFVRLKRNIDHPLIRQPAYWAPPGPKGPPWALKSLGPGPKGPPWALLRAWARALLRAWARALLRAPLGPKGPGPGPF